MQKTDRTSESRSRPTSSGACRLDLSSEQGCARASPDEDFHSPLSHYADAAPEIGGFAKVLSGPLGGLAIQKLRIRPLQVRSIQSVERILSAAADILLHRRSRRGVNMNTIAGLARVTPQAAYRYFKNSDELTTAVLRCLAIREYQRIIEELSGKVLSSEAEMAGAVVSVVLDACRRLVRYPAHLQADITQEYRQIGYDAALIVSKIIYADVNSADVRASFDVIEASVALTASAIPSFHETATKLWIALDRCTTSAKCSMRGRRRSSGMLGMRS